jgi:hypothetical protein
MLSVGLILMFALALALPRMSTAFTTFGEAPATPYVTAIDCSAIPNVTHQFFRDGRTHYTIPGQCQVKKSNGQTVVVRYHVDGNWTPGPKSFATEAGRIYDLGNLAPELFQPGPPGHYTTFIVRLLCEADPWLNDARCGLEYASGVDELAKLFDRFSRGPFPLTKGAIPASRRAALLTEYKRATGQFVGPSISTAVRKTAPSFAAKQPPPPPPKPSAPYGAKYQPATLQALNRNQTRTLAVQVTNTGGLTWTPTNPNPFRLSYHWFRGTQEVIRDGLRTNLPAPVASTKSVTLNANLRAPSSPGTYILKWDMLQEGVTWFRNKGVPTFDQTVVVK